MLDFEKLGVFYLGRPYDLARREPLPGLLLYESKDLVTHAVCVGMTGSGKTGLCIGLLEEAAIDGVPAIVIDPKGDLGNLLLTFPRLEGQDFQPWINEDAARNEGVTPEEFAAREASRWSSGLAGWGQDGDRIRRLQAAADFSLYTPGSSAGTPVSIIKSFAAPPASVLDDRELLRERIQATATSLLGLLGMDVNPLESREHILISTILSTAWREGLDLDLETIIQRIQTPPVARIGVFDIDSFYPPKDRFALAMQLNNLLASPGFEAWLEGEPLDVGRFLYSAQGKPRISIFSIAHLNDSERMFFVSLLLNQVLGWMRTQPGTTSLRAILYMDEIFGYFPPIANPPSKTPLLTLLKQARAYGLGVVLATQNPVDLDYKGLSNAGTWFIGRLQTERDKARVLEGLEGASNATGGAFDRGRMEALLAGLGSRVFLLNNVHEREPVLFETRWTLSYLAGPLTRAQIRSLRSQPALASPPPAAPQVAVVPAGGTRPVVPPEIPQYFATVGEGGACRPVIAGHAQLHFVDAKAGVDEVRPVLFLCPVQDGPIPVEWSNAEPASLTVDDLVSEPAPGVTFADLPAPAAKARNYALWSKAFSTWLYQTQAIELWRSPSTGLCSRPGEAEGQFRVRLRQAAREERDEAIEKLRARYAGRIATLQDRLRRSEQALEREREQSSTQNLNAAVSVATGLLGALFGRRSLSTSASSAARNAARSRKESSDVARASQAVEDVRAQLEDLEAKVEQEAADLQARIDPTLEELERVAIRLKKTNIEVRFVALLWVNRI